MPTVHGLRADDLNRNDRQKWEVVQRLKFKYVQKCLLDISSGNGVHKDLSVYGTWAFLYVAWHYTEIFFSLHASLRERVKYASFIAIFYSIWRNWIIVTDGYCLKNNFLTRECFQDVLLSCHFAVILISYFRDEHPNLECPLHLTGTDCCERYFSENGSFVLNRHNYTFLDIHTNLRYIPIQIYGSQSESTITILEEERQVYWKVNRLTVSPSQTLPPAKSASPFQ